MTSGNCFLFFVIRQFFIFIWKLASFQLPSGNYPLFILILEDFLSSGSWFLFICLLEIAFITFLFCKFFFSFLLEAGFFSFAFWKLSSFRSYSGSFFFSSGSWVVFICLLEIVFISFIFWKFFFCSFLLEDVFFSFVFWELSSFLYYSGIFSFSSGRGFSVFRKLF